MPHRFDWRSSAKADALYKLERYGFAWEFLRRNHHYRKAYAQWCRQRAPDATVIADRLARWGLSFRVRPGASGGPGTSSVAAGIRAQFCDRRASSQTVPQSSGTEILAHRQRGGGSHDP